MHTMVVGKLLLRRGGVVLYLCTAIIEYSSTNWYK